MLCFPLEHQSGLTLGIFEHDVGYRVVREDSTASRRSVSTWINVLLEKHAWVSAGLVWMPSASDFGTKGAFEDSKSDALDFRPTINLELWKDGSRVVRLVSGCNPLNPCH